MSSSPPTSRSSSLPPREEPMMFRAEPEETEPFGMCGGLSLRGSVAAAIVQFHVVPRVIDRRMGCTEDTVQPLSKLYLCPEAFASAPVLSGALAAGLFRGYAAGSDPASGDEFTFSDRLLDSLSSPSGERLASADGSDLVLAFYSAPSGPSAGTSSPSWVDVATTGRCRRAIRSWVEVFTATAVSVFIDKTIHINTYDQLFAAATNPSYGARLQQLRVALCNASVETLVKTSHSVLSNPNTNAIGNGSGQWQWWCWGRVDGDRIRHAGGAKQPEACAGFDWQSNI
ncbi:hypothetical protein ABZP36_000642 [Zizania latifolia]